MSQPLAGKNILVTRAVQQAAEFVRKIGEAGGKAVIFPTIDIRPVTEWGACDKAIEGLYMYDGLAFTSVNAAEYFFRRYKEAGHTIGELLKKQIFAVGEKTRQFLEKEGIHVTHVPEKFTSSDLSRLLQQEDLQGKSYLFPGGNLTRETLSDNLRMLGANVDPLVVYMNVVPDKGDIEKLHARFAADDIDIMTFLSPSAFKNFTLLFSVERTREYAERALMAAIGPTTAEAIRQHGIEVDIIPEVSTTDGMVEAMGRYVTEHGGTK